MARIDYYRDPDVPTANSIVVAVSAVVSDSDGRVLLIRRTDNGLYAIPGDALEVGETLGDAVRREALDSDPEHVIEFSDGEIRRGPALSRMSLSGCQ